MKKVVIAVTMLEQIRELHLLFMGAKDECS